MTNPNTYIPTVALLHWADIELDAIALETERIAALAREPLPLIYTGQSREAPWITAQQLQDAQRLLDRYQTDPGLAQLVPPKSTSFIRRVCARIIGV